MSGLRFLTAGESHGQCLTAIVEGIPAGYKWNSLWRNYGRSHHFADCQQGLAELDRSDECFWL